LESQKKKLKIHKNIKERGEGEGGKNK